LLPSDAYTCIWLFIADSRGGHDALPELEKNATKVKSDSPAYMLEVIQYFLGKETPESVLSAAKDSDTEKDKLQLTLANFFLWEYALIHNNRDQAIQYFQDAVALKVEYSFEYNVALAELKRLNPS
jgi:lipoprotein NlpI